MLGVSTKGRKRVSVLREQTIAEERQQQDKDLRHRIRFHPHAIRFNTHGKVLCSLSNLGFQKRAFDWISGPS